MYALGPGPGKSLTTHGKTEYEAGDIKKPGSFARGSGATPALLGDQYIAITNNANDRVNLVIYHQDAKEKDEDQVVCKLPMFAWEVPDLRIQSMPLISTKNGLVYGYTQSVDDSLDGIWVWYVVALDWRTGKEVWRVRAGAGGTYNDDYQPGALGRMGVFIRVLLEV